MWRWLIWLTPPWGRNARRRAVLKQVKRWQAEERRRAFGRIADYSRQWDGPNFGGPTSWVGQTRAYPTVRPLLTRGQAARSDDPES